MIIYIISVIQASLTFPHRVLKSCDSIDEISVLLQTGLRHTQHEHTLYLYALSSDLNTALHSYIYQCEVPYNVIYIYQCEVPYNVIYIYQCEVPYNVHTRIVIPEHLTVFGPRAHRSHRITFFENLKCLVLCEE